ncbi:hypothetical protein [Pseudomonas orientalis]|uniref:hypothetical protein n=1 Tax=Pseudomonas orientalis TaxID=76758 RepID=UPI000F55CA28|nr:hypothetical protein [Pseudomonas orientalis]
MAKLTLTTCDVTGGLLASLAIVLGFMFLVLMFALVNESQEPIAAEFSAKEDRKMVRKIETGAYQAIVGVGTGLYANYLPKLIFRA